MSKLLGILALTVTLGTLALAGCGKTVEAAPVTVTGLITLMPASVSLVTNQSKQITAVQTTGQDTGIEDITQTAIWQSSSSADLLVTNGKVTCKRAGSYMVSVSTIALSSSIPITCTAPIPVQLPTAPTAPAAPTPPSSPAPTAPTLTGIAFLNPPSIVRSNAPTALSLQGTYADHAIADVTEQATWKGDNVARVGTNGVVYCSLPGIATVSAAVGSYAASTSIQCLLKSVTAAPGFAEHAAKFYGPFPSWLNVKNFGATGDGTTDDTQAIQRSLAAAANQKKTLFFPDGVYVISSTLHSVATDNLTIVGANVKTSVLLWHGPTQGKMVSFDGDSHLHFYRMSLDSNHGAASIGVHLGSTFLNGQLYPTFDALEDLYLSGFEKGIEDDFAGETTINRVHCDHCKYGVSTINYNALNINIIDSLFTDNEVPITNDPGAGAFNVSNSVFVRSTRSDMLMGNAQAFSIRHNLSVDSQAFFTALNCECGAAVTLEGNVVRSTKGLPIVFGNQGPVMLVDNSFESPVDPKGPLFLGTGWVPTYIVSLGNQFSTATPYKAQAGSAINLTSIDESQMASVPVSQWQAPDEVYIPQASTAPVFEVLGNGVDSIQNAIDQAKTLTTGAIVHVPAGNYYQNTAIDVPDVPGLTIAGDGQNTNLIAGTMLAGPIMRTHGSIEMDGLVLIGSGGNSSLKVSVNDQPSTTILCDMCTTIDSVTGVTVSGLDNAIINTRATTLNGQSGVSLVGGVNQANGKQTLGRFDAFMSTSDTYRISNGGHFLISDGWHDAGQSQIQAQVSSGAIVTQEGGAICTPSATGVQAIGLTGQLSMVGVSVNTTITADSASTGTLGLIGSLTAIVSTELQSDGSSLNVVHGGDALNTYSSANVIPLSTTPVVPMDVERVLSQARTEFVIPRQSPASGQTLVRLHRIMVARSGVGISFTSDDANSSAAYGITAPAGSTAPTSCTTDSLSLDGTWTLTSGADGFYGLLRGGGYLTNTVSSTNSTGKLGTTAGITDAGQRWLIQPAGDGLFHVINRADGSLLTRLGSGCASVGTATGDTSQEWRVAAK